MPVATKKPGTNARGGGGKKSGGKSKEPQETVLKVELNNGVQIPLLGLGTWKWKTNTASGMNNTERAVEFALENGYRHIDTDEKYDNLEDIGKGMKAFFEKQLGKEDTPIQRKHIFISCKLWGTSHRNVEEAYQRICGKLGVDQLDCLYLGTPCALQVKMIDKVAKKIKGKTSPGPNSSETKVDEKEAGKEIKPKKVINLHPKSPEGDYLLDEDIDYVDVWKQMEKLIFNGRVKSLGLAHFNQDQIYRLLQNCACKPQMVQTELHPLLQNRGLLDFCRERGIIVSAFGPSGSLATSNDSWQSMKKRLNAQLIKAGAKTEDDEDAPVLKSVLKLAMAKKALGQSLSNATVESEDATAMSKLQIPGNQVGENNEDDNGPKSDRTYVKETKETTETAEESGPVGEQPAVEENAESAAIENNTEQSENPETPEPAPEKEKLVAKTSTNSNRTSRPPKKATVRKAKGGRKRSVSKEQKALEDANKALTRRDSVRDIDSKIHNPDAEAIASRLAIPGAASGLTNNALKFSEEMKIRSIASSHNVVSHHVISRWSLQLGCILIQSSFEVSAIRSANKVFSFELKPKELETLQNMNKYHRSYTLPEFRYHRFYPYKHELALIDAVNENMEQATQKLAVRNTTSPVGEEEITSAEEPKVGSTQRKSVAATKTLGLPKVAKKKQPSRWN